ncbi:hypothetical protein [Pseudomaricurvus sp. HS19]|uniref:hypothetical protein n=1 Tax=Pseudomaricurvus sp. HS19 TaxID=2692626 RepID=UPI001370F25A|nr:hypothetical protein [Pseudomaricurvus sp. HS19]MYM64894.1 hypothetical protein [Pseudomaricurvus sp. HS19]
MRILALLVTLLIIGFLVTKQLNTPATVGGDEAGIPHSAVPDSKEDLDNLQDNLDNLLEQSTQQRLESVEE